MTPYSISCEARRDLDAIWYAIAKHNLAAADRMLVKLFDVFLHLSRSPLAGESCDELRPGLRRFCVGNYVVYHKVARRVAVARVLHGAPATRILRLRTIQVRDRPCDITPTLPFTKFAFAPCACKAAFA